MARTSDREIEHLLRRAGFGARPDELDMYGQMSIADAGALGATEGARYMAAKAAEDLGRVRGQIEMLRENALGNFRDILVNIAKDVAMLVWLDGRTNTRAKPQENFAREIMELFTMGVGNYTEPDVYAGARVFSGWNLARPGNAADGSLH